MHPSKVARIHTSQEWKEDKKKKEKKSISVGKKLVRHGIRNHAG